MGKSTDMSERAAAQHCPYCADTNLWPLEEGWECRSCLRSFAVTYLGMVQPHGSTRPSDGPQPVAGADG